jgi:hypothetical protein
MSLTIRPVKVKTHDQVVHPLLPTHPSLVAIVAPRKSGKTTLLINMLTRNDMFKGFFHQIHIFSPTIDLDPKWKIVSKHLPKEMLHNHFDEAEFSTLLDTIREKSKDSKREGKGGKEDEREHEERDSRDSKKKQNILFVFDDSASEKGLFSRNMTSPTIQAAFTSRHYNVSMWIVSQAYKAISPGFRNNVHHWIIFNTPNENEAKKMAEELSGPLNAKQFLRLLFDITSKPFHFLYINFEADNKFDYFRDGFSKPIKLEPYLRMYANEESLQTTQRPK